MIPVIGDGVLDWADELPGVLGVCLSLFGDACVETTAVVAGVTADCIGLGYGGCRIGVFCALDTVSLISSSDESSSVPTLLLFP